MANAFFCTFPCRNAPNQHFSKPGLSQKRPHADQSEGRGTGKREGGGGGGRGEGRTLDSAPKDPYGATTPRLKKQSSSNTDPFRNTEGQLSLFAYFKKAEPKSSFKPESSKTSLPAVTSRHFDNGQDKGREIGVEREDLSEHVKVESGRESHRTGNESATRRPPPTGGREHKRPFPRYPSINFSSLFYSDEIRNPCTSTNAAKLRCIIHYFDRILQQSRSFIICYQLFLTFVVVFAPCLKCQLTCHDVFWLK